MWLDVVLWSALLALLLLLQRWVGKRHEQAVELVTKTHPMPQKPTRVASHASGIRIQVDIKFQTPLPLDMAEVGRKSAHDIVWMAFTDRCIQIPDPRLAGTRVGYSTRATTEVVPCASSSTR